jgi:hypothetical protein
VNYDEGGEGEVEEVMSVEECLGNDALEEWEGEGGQRGKSGVVVGGVIFWHSGSNNNSRGGFSRPSGRDLVLSCSLARGGNAQQFPPPNEPIFSLCCRAGAAGPYVYARP